MESTDIDIVDTSDVEEYEVILSRGAGPCISSASTPKRVCAPGLVPLKSIATENDQQWCPNPLFTSRTRDGQFSDSEAGNSSPRKRIKIAHDMGSSSHDSALPIPAGVSLIDSPRKEVTLDQAPPSIPKLSPKRALTDEDRIQQPVSPSCDASPRSDWNSSPIRSPVKYISPDATGQLSQACPQSMVASSSSHPLAGPIPCSLSSSTDRCSLFSSPLRVPLTPPVATSQRSHGPSTSGKRDLISSPLTPISSPVVHAQRPSESPDPLQLTSTRRLQANLPPRSDSLPTAPHVSHSPPTEIPEDAQPFNRYSLRRREARQLNPYAYDKLMYKQQLKSLPDAIVKFRSPHRRSGTGEGGENSTQDEFIFPTDNLDEDGDYVAMEGESGRRRKRKGSGRDSEIMKDVRGEVGAGPADKGWLPEALRELSSSDEDDSKMQKLAKRIRREREKAEAMVRAEAKKAATEARRAETEARKASKRPRPFPVHENAASRHVPPEPSPSPSLFPRAHSEPTASCAASPPRLPRRFSVSPRSSSQSPTSSSKAPQLPDFSDCLQQDDICRFDDFDALSPQDLSSGDPYPIISSPSGPPTTPGASALLSNTSGMESESDHLPTLEMSSKDKKRLRALKRMMPAAMISRELEATKSAHSTHARARIAIESSGSEAEEVRLIPGLARARTGRYRDVEVRGDPESSDAERHPTEAHNGKENVDAGLDGMELPSDGESTVRVERTRQASRRIKHDDEVISLSDSSRPDSSEDSESSGDDEKAHQSLFDHPTRGPARERSLIDWMLCRNGGPNKPKSRFKQSARSRKSRGSGAPRLNIIVSGARRYGDQHQTLLPFVRTDTSSNATPSTERGSGNRNRTAQLDHDTTEENKKRKKKRRRHSGNNQGPIYNVYHDATHITSRHREGKSSRGRTALIIKDDDNESRQALDPGWRAEVERWNKPVPSVPQPVVKVGTSASTAPRPRLHRRPSPPRQSEIPLPLYFQREEEPFASVHHRITIDMNITPFPSGVKFGVSSYIGRGYLHQLISVTSDNSEIGPPTFCYMQGFEISSTTSAAVFSALLGPLCDRLTGALRDFKVDDVDTVKEWESLMRASCHLLSWVAVHAEDQEFITLEVALREYLSGLSSVLRLLETNTFLLSAHWFVVELFARLAVGVKYRRGTVDNVHLFQFAGQLVRRLMDIDLQPAFATFHAAEGDIDVTLVSCRAAELWICLIHLLADFEKTWEANLGHPLWRLLANLHPESSPTGLEASEDMWRSIFSLCAISQFSVHGLSTSIFRLPAAWELVAAALKKIVLIYNPEKDRQLPPRALRKRDDYISCVVSRCFLLWKQWGWRLDDGAPMFRSLQEIFRSRNFANLFSERSIPMGFLESGDLDLLSKQDPHDSVFEVFLKMVVQAVYLLNANAELDPKQRSAHIKKLLQIAVPVSPVPFSRSSPPSAHSLSMLVNRFSAMAVAVHLDPTHPNVKFRIAQARRCVNFRDADDHSRMACVYGMMNFAMIVRHHKTVGGLAEVLGWLAEMADTLMDEYKEGEIGAGRRKPTTTLIQLLIGSVRRMIETPSLDKGESRGEYPDLALLDGPWVTRVFNPRTDLVTIQQTGVEIRMLVQSFLDARMKALPAIQPPPPPVVHSIESQESQDEYDKMFLYIKDEELLAALGEEAKADTVADLKSKEEALCKVLDKSITPAVYRLVCKHFDENELAKNDAASAKAADEWIDCWVGCANVLVQNKYKEWGLYMKLGQQSWEKIIDDSWRRRVGLRFNLKLLCLDPGAYDKMKDDFLAVLLVATLSCKTTIEHEFISVVLSLDGLRHPLLRGTPLDPILGTKKYEIGPTDYEMARERLIQTVFANTARLLSAGVDAESQGYAELVVRMLSTMRDIYQSAEEKEEYGGFCRRVYDMLLGHPELVSHPRLSDALAWGRRSILA